MASTIRMDELVKDYLLFRGFNATLKTLENELKNDKDRGFRVDRVIELFNIYINSYDLANLREYWLYLDRRLFCRLEPVYASSVRKLEVSLFKLYLVNAVQNNKPDKVNEFFEKMTVDLHSQPEWKDWFALPFMKSPEENAMFAIYFSRQWQETFYLSLYNFLGIVFQCMPRPSIMQFEQDQKRIAELEEENNLFKKQIASLLEKRELEQKLHFSHPREQPSPVATPGATAGDLMDDFYVISQDTTILEKDVSKPSQIKSFIKNIASASSTQTTKKSAPPKKAAPKEYLVKPNMPKAESKPKEIVPKVRLRSDDGVVSTSPGGKMAADVSSQPVVTSSGHQVRDKSQAKTSDLPPLKPVTVNVSSPKEKVMRSGLPISKAKDNPTEPALSVGVQDNVPHASENKVTASESHKAESLTVQPGLSDTSSVIQDHTRPATDVIDDSHSSLIPLSQEEYSEHQASISHCRFNSNGHMVATADVEGVVKIWSLQPSPVTVASIMSKSMFLSLDWHTKNEQLVLLGNKLGCVKLFDVKQKKVAGEANMEASYQRIVSLSCSPNGSVFACSAAGKAKLSHASPETGLPRLGKLVLCDLNSLTVKRTLPLGSNQPSMNCTSFDQTGQLLLAGGADGTLRLFDLEMNNCVGCWPAHQGEVYTISMTPDGNTCYSMGSDGKFRQWTLHKPGQLLADLAIHPGACGPFVLSAPAGYRQVQTPKGKLFDFDAQGQHVVTCAQKIGVIYKINQGVLSHSLNLVGHKTPVTCVDWSSSLDCHMCLTASMDGKVKVSTLLPK